jgi:hypothetical protein
MVREKFNAAAAVPTLPSEEAMSTSNIVSEPWESEWHKAEGESSDGPGYWTIDAIVMKGSPTSYGTVADTLNRDYRISPEQDEAHARLIAAAPEMLAELKRLVESFGWTDNPACRLIERVEGKQ